MAPTLPWMTAAAALLEEIAATQAEAIETASQWCADAIAADGLVHLFGTGHSRIPVEEMFPRYGSYPGFNPIVELSMTFHTQVVGANGQRQAMFIERTPGLAEVILSNFTFGPRDVMVVFSAGGTTAVPVEMARGARAPRPAGHRGHVGRASRCRRTSTRRRQPPARRGGPRHRPLHPAGGRAGATIAGPRHPRRPRLDPRGRRDRQCHQGPDGRAPRRAWSHAPGHHPRQRRRAPSAPGRCSTRPIESMHGGSPVRSASEEVDDGPTSSTRTGDRWPDRRPT